MLFKVLLLGLAVWVILLLIMYFKTIYPTRHPTTVQTAASLGRATGMAIRPGASDFPSAPLKSSK